jgi:hypothetical protein
MGTDGYRIYCGYSIVFQRWIYLHYATVILPTYTLFATSLPSSEMKPMYASTVSPTQLAGRGTLCDSAVRVASAVSKTASDLAGLTKASNALSVLPAVLEPLLSV